MINIQKLFKSNRALNAFIGLKRCEFEKLCSTFENAWNKAEAKRISETNRKRKPGGGRKSILLTTELKLLFILVYWKIYPTQDLQGVLFEMTQATVNDWYQRLWPILKESLGQDLYLPARKTRTLLELTKKYPELIFIIDGSERPVRRPKCSRKQRQRYSGKKKRHTIKNTILVHGESKEIVFASKTQDGNMHDKRMAEKDELELPEGSLFFKDLGYQGYALENVYNIAPKKKPRKKDLSKKDKEINRRISRYRVRVEHSIGGMKHFRICSDIYRNCIHNFEDAVIEIGSGLYNFRLNQRDKIAA